MKYLRDEALSWHHFWKINGRPKAGHIAEMHRISRARYHRSIRHIQRNKKIIQSEKMAHAVVSNNSRDLWSEVRNVKGSNVNGSCDSKEITELFSEKYKHLYNSVPYNIDDMHAIESTIFERLHNCEDVKYVISHSDVINAVSHFKKSKSDGSEGLFSDHFLHATHRIYVILSILYTLFYRMVLAQIQLLWGQ